MASLYLARLTDVAACQLSEIVKLVPPTVVYLKTARDKEKTTHGACYSQSQRIVVLSAKTAHRCIEQPQQSVP